ncbi:MAG TPA: hypothetical protein VNS63_27635 [Blastocatellia bacterium]|nr:hypothetical protein [Blastocatellia bacterium]
MQSVSRRSIVGILFSGALVGLILPSRTKAADQPHMQAAIEALRTAQRELQAASTDKGGHRAKALGLVNNAISEVEKGIAYDRAH